MKLETRIERAEAVLQYYVRRNGEPYYNLQIHLIDLLTDLRHYCSEEGLDFTKAVYTSEIRYEEGDHAQ